MMEMETFLDTEGTELHIDYGMIPLGDHSNDPDRELITLYVYPRENALWLDKNKLDELINTLIRIRERRYSL